MRIPTSIRRAKTCHNRLEMRNAVWVAVCAQNNRKWLTEIIVQQEVSCAHWFMEFSAQISSNANRSYVFNKKNKLPDLMKTTLKLCNSFILRQMIRYCRCECTTRSLLVLYFTRSICPCQNQCVYILVICVQIPFRQWTVDIFYSSTANA